VWATFSKCPKSWCNLQERMGVKETITHRPMVFERKILRKIFGPTYENGFW
jgi:hypothetical protein